MRNFNLNDTIVAISTPIGEAGIGIVRLSGPKSLKVADKIFKPANQKSRKILKPSQSKSYSVHYGWIVEAQSPKIIDEVLLTVMRAPKTYTREDIVEINCHSGIVPLKKILDLVLNLGARMAQAGEFTKRAFLNGRIDLAQAEAVLEIVRTKSQAYHQACLNRLSGRFSQTVNPLIEELFDILAQCEAQIDFPEEDTSQPVAPLVKRIEHIQDALGKCLKSTQESKIIRDGLSVVIAGRPNVGKSSLLNALLNEERALVTPFAGTTRDAIEEQVCFDGVPLRLIDTAGLRKAQHPVEKEAAKRSHKFIETAQLILLLFDASKPCSVEDKKFIAGFKKQKNALAILNKIDLPLKFSQNMLKVNFGSFLKISALKGSGLELLKRNILKHIWQGKIGLDDYQFVVNSRQEQLLEQAIKSISESLKSFKTGLPLEIAVEDLKQALSLLHQLCGSSTDIEEELLDSIFSQFCIGK